MLERADIKAMCMPSYSQYSPEPLPSKNWELHLLIIITICSFLNSHLAMRDIGDVSQTLFVRLLRDSVVLTHLTFPSLHMGAARYSDELVAMGNCSIRIDLENLCISNQEDECKALIEV